MSRSTAAPTRIFNWEDVCGKASDQLMEILVFIRHELSTGNHPLDKYKRLVATHSYYYALYLRACDSYWADHVFNQYLEFSSDLDAKRVHYKKILMFCCQE